MLCLLILKRRNRAVQGQYLIEEADQQLLIGFGPENLLESEVRKWIEVTLQVVTCSWFSSMAKIRFFVEKYFSANLVKGTAAVLQWGIFFEGMAYSVDAGMTLRLTSHAS